MGQVLQALRLMSIRRVSQVSHVSQIMCVVLKKVDTLSVNPDIGLQSVLSPNHGLHCLI